MSVSLQKGQRVDLTKGTSLKTAKVCIGWDTNRYDGSAEFDLDVEAFMLGSNGKCISDEHFIFYNNPKDPEGSIEHSGDNRTGAGDGDDEVILVTFEKVNPKVQSIIFTVTIHEARQRAQNFGMVENAYIRVEDAETNTEICRYDLGEDFSIQTSVVVGELYKNGTDWKFKAVGMGYARELADFCREYGINIG